MQFTKLSAFLVFMAWVNVDVSAQNTPDAELIGVLDVCAAETPTQAACLSTMFEGGEMELSAYAWDGVPENTEAFTQETMSLADFNRIEFDYEVKGLAVVERKGDMYRVKYGDKTVWILGDDGTKYRNAPRLLVGSLAYVTEGGDFLTQAGESYDPGTQALEKDQSLNVIRYANFIDDRRDRATLEPWLQVQIIANPCTGAGEIENGSEGESKVVAGSEPFWMPLYSAENKLNVWLHPRGC